MDKVKFKTTMYRSQKRPISELNGCITCKLCKGYFIDATTIIECLHTFCRTCIVRYLESNKYCPICDVQVHKTKPLLSIRRDKTIQDLVYKLVPRLYHNEAKRRQTYYEEHPEAKPSIFEESTATQYEFILAPDEAINLTLTYCGTNAPRYLRCPSAVTISHLKKLIQAKYELTDRHKVDVFYNDDILNPSFSLMDVAYIHSWNKKEPLDLSYKIYECRAKKLKLDCLEGDSGDSSKSAHNNNNNWKEVQLRISENGEMSITGIQDAGMLELLDATEKFKSEIVINESKNIDNYPKPVQVKSDVANDEGKIQATNEEAAAQENHLPAKKELPELKVIGKTSSTNTKLVANTKLLNSGIKMVINNAKSSATKFPNSNAKKTSVDCTTDSTSTVGKAFLPKAPRIPKSIELSETLNLNNELSVIPLSASASCVSLSSCGGTTTVFSTISKSMCSTKSDDSYSSNPGIIERNAGKTPVDVEKQPQTNSVSKESNNLKRKCEENEKSAEIPAKLPKPTILNHSIGLMNLSNNHPLKKHSKLNRNGERKIHEISDKMPVSSQNLTVSHVMVSQKPPPQDIVSSKPVIINKNLSYLQLNRSGTPKLSLGQKSAHSGNLPCYMPKMSLNSLGSKHEKNGEKVEEPKPLITHPHAHYPPIITPAQLPHHQNLNSLQLKPPPTSNSDKFDQENVKGDPYKLNAQSNTQHSPATQKSSDNNGESHRTQDSVVPAIVLNNSLSTTIKTKPSTPIGYKTLRDPPKSWNSQINSQIARVNQNVKAQQLANAAAAIAGGGGNAQGRYGGDLKSVRPAKFFKGRNMPRYLGNPSSGVKPMYQVHISPEKDKNQEHQVQNAKSEKSEIKKHSIVKIDPKTLKPISEKAPETSNLSNISSNVAQSQELRASTSPGDLKINTSSVSIFNPLKLQQNSPKNERKSPKSPHSPKVKTSPNSTATAVSTSTPTNSSPSPSLSPKQQRDKTSLTFTPPNPFVPNLTSPTLNPNQFLYPAGGFPSYDPRFMAACHSLWYTQRMAAAAAAGLVPPPLPHAFGLNIGLNPATTIGQQSRSPGVSPKHPPSTKSSGQPSPKTSSTTTSPSKSSPTAPANKKIKESTTAKSEKSLEIALEKLTQSKVKELGSNGEAKTTKNVRNGSPKTTEILVEKTSPKHSTDSGPNTSALQKLSQNKAIEILSGKKSAMVGDKEARNSSASNDVVSRELPTTEQTTSIVDEEKSGEPDSSLEISDAQEASRKPLVDDKEEKPPVTSAKENEVHTTELQSRLGPNQENETGQEDNKHHPSETEIVKAKDPAPSDKLEKTEANAEQKQSSDNRSCDASDKQKKDVPDTTGNCVNDTSSSDVASGGKTESVESKSSEDANEKESDSGCGGEKTNSV